LKYKVTIKVTIKLIVNSYKKNVTNNKLSYRYKWKERNETVKSNSDCNFKL